MPIRLPAALVALSLVALAPAADWPRFRGPDGSGISPEKGLPVTWSREGRRVEDRPARAGRVEPRLHRRPHLPHRLDRLRGARPARRPRGGPEAAPALPRPQDRQAALEQGRARQAPREALVARRRGLRFLDAGRGRRPHLLLLRQDRRHRLRSLRQATLDRGRRRRAGGMGLVLLADPSRRPRHRERLDRERVARGARQDDRQGEMARDGDSRGLQHAARGEDQGWPG